MSALLDHPRKHLITAEEYFRMGEAGVFAPEARLELIEGEIIEMAPIGSPHAGCVNRLTRIFIQRAGGEAVVAVQNPVLISNLSVPQPDFALLAARADDYAAAHPQVADVYLVVEVADTTVKFDLGRKATIYARCGITELWVVDVNERAIHVFRQPGGDGYGEKFRVGAGQSVACAALGAIEIEVAELFPAG
ncbi:MAG TPA: Uma2 family endonuclease [Usitatibacter sp.]|nr:Uma2 family endonuclease [Usitatibacter sp.]